MSEGEGGAASCPCIFVYPGSLGDRRGTGGTLPDSLLLPLARDKEGDLLPPPRFVSTFSCVSLPLARTVCPVHTRILVTESGKFKYGAGAVNDSLCQEQSNG